MITGKFRRMYYAGNLSVTADWAKGGRKAAKKHERVKTDQC